MNYLKLCLAEIKGRKSNFGFGLLAVTVATAMLSGALLILQNYNQHTREILSTKKVDLQKRIHTISNEVHEAMLNLGFNIAILPANQNLGSYFAENYASKTMPEEYKDRLAQAEIATIEEIVPVLRQAIDWRERKWTVILSGRDGKAIHRADKKRSPKTELIPPGKVVLGHEIHSTLGYNPGDSISINGHKLEVLRCRPQMGNLEDMTIGMDLKEAQRILDLPKRINELLALKCRTAWLDLARVREEIGNILPGTQVIEKGSHTLAKTRAIENAEREGRLAIQREKKYRNEIRKNATTLGLLIIALTILICTTWLGVLTESNVRQRRQEIGILAAIGIKSGSIVGLFVLRSTLIGVLGALLGFTLSSIAVGFQIAMLPVALLSALIITQLATALPLIKLTRSQPADILHD